MVLRNLTYGVFSSFLPLMLQGRGVSTWTGGIALSVFLALGVIGEVLGGFPGDRLKREAIFAVTMGLAALFLAGFLGTKGSLSLLLLFLGGFFLMMSGPMAQEMFPASRPRWNG